MRLSDSVWKLKCMMWMAFRVWLSLVECIEERIAGGCSKMDLAEEASHYLYISFQCLSWNLFNTIHDTSSHIGTREGKVLSLGGYMLDCDCDPTT